MAVKRAPRSYSSPTRDAAAGRTRARIVAAACTLLAGVGKKPFSLEAVAQQAAVTRLTVYNHFQSKRGLMEAVFDDLAQRGGLSGLREVFADPDPRQALHRLVSVFCRFWSAHRAVLPNFRAVIRADDELAATLKERAERRRQALSVLVGRMTVAQGRGNANLVDVLFALTSFEMFEALLVRNRTAKAVEALIQALVEQTITEFCAGR